MNNNNNNTQVQAQENNQAETKKITVKGVLVGIGMFAAGAAAGAAGMYLYESHKDTTEPSAESAFI